MSISIICLSVCGVINFELQKQPPEVFYEKDVLRNFTKFTGKHLCQKKRLWHTTRFLVNFVKFLRTPILQNTSGRLLLELVSAFSQDCFAT